MLRIKNISKTFGGQEIFKEVNWFISPSDRVALVGINGSGKSTLLRIIADIESADKGIIDKPKSSKVGYLAQTGFILDEATVRQEARRGFDEILSLQTELADIDAELSGSTEESDLTALIERQAVIHDRLSILGAHDIDRQVSDVLTGLGFAEADFDTDIASLSGGWQMRAALARILLQRPEYLLLDEPTNHLDIEARAWLESYLANYPFACVLVSHDRFFLDNCVTRVTEITGRHLEEYTGNFTKFEQEREKRNAIRTTAYEKQQDEIKRIMKFIERFRSKNTKAPQVQSRIKMLAKMVRLDPPEAPVRGMNIPLPPAPRSGRIVLELKQLCKSYGDNQVLKNIDLKCERGGRIALVGPNGAGKSTLMRALAGQEDADGGERKAGHNLAPAFFAQDQTEALGGRETVLESVASVSPNEFLPQIRNLLGAFLFSGKMVDKLVSVLSGGERNRLALARLLVRPSNLLLLDEPTNHLDLRSKDVLLKALRDYDGTIIFVSHDRHFLSELADHIVEVGGGGLREYPGDYESYLWRRQNIQGLSASPEAKARVTPAIDGKKPSDIKKDSENNRAAARKAEASSLAAGRGNVRRLGRIEEEIAELEDRKSRFSKVMSSRDFFTNRTKAELYLDQMKEVEAALAKLYAEWESLAD
jgi:ATP-binding cassette, subfamily F, member 3